MHSLHKAFARFQYVFGSGCHARRLDDSDYHTDRTPHTGGDAAHDRVELWLAAAALQGS